MGLFLEWLGVTTARGPIQAGEAAPDILARDETGREVRLSEYYHDGYTLLYFYPKADTPGCTMQACNLRDGWGELQAKNVRIVGVSSNDIGTQRRFREKHQLPFPLLADEDRLVAQAFGVPTIFGMAKRQSFLIKGGKVVWVDLNASPRWQTQDVLKAIEKLAPAEGTAAQGS